MPEKEYDDEVVRLLGAGELSCKEIAERVGLTGRMVNAIVRGRGRPELLPRICAGLRASLKESLRMQNRQKAELDGQPLSPASMRKKKYDDDKLVKEIVSGELTHAEIGQRAGLSARHVSRIACGQCRPDLQPRIKAARQAYLERAEKLGVQAAERHAVDPPEPPSCRKKEYDENQLVEDLAAGLLSHGQIAQRAGLSTAMVAMVAGGKCRSDLYRRVQERRGRYRDEAFQVGRAYVKRVLAKHIRIGMEHDGELGRRCRKDFLEWFLDDPPEEDRDQAPHGPVEYRQLAGHAYPADWDNDSCFQELPEPLKIEVIRALGGRSNPVEWGGGPLFMELLDPLRTEVLRALGGPEA